MRFEVRYSNGALHEVELSGTLAVVGRDPSCDLVLNDAKCSRRHAVIEAGPDGLLVRDSGSANGIYVNGKKADRASLKHGDEIRLGEVVLKVLPEEVAGTLVMGPDELPDAIAPPPVSGEAKTVPPSFPNPPIAVPPVPAAAAKPAPPAPLPRMSPKPQAAAPAARPRQAEPPRVEKAPRPPMRPLVKGDGGPVEPLPRPMTGMVLAALWLLCAVAELAGAGLVIWLARTGRISPLWSAGLLLLALVSVVLGVGLWMRAPWARLLQIATAGIGLLTCVATPLSAAALAYILRNATRIHYSGRNTFGDLTPEEVSVIRGDSGDGLYMAGVLVGLLVTLILAGVAVALGLPALSRPAV